ncbi:hypothetical protein LCGC14_1926180 [marine sediment metagenome]|uniref:Uncharacterized protein n=1 Tax=marine sediment metagenome TaxID=412755 RepID=A0A0F9FPZ5_9ZZZZ
MVIKMTNNNKNKKIQDFEYELRSYNKFGKKELFKTFFDLNLRNSNLKDFIDEQYSAEQYSFDSLFGEEHQREDLDYVMDIFEINFKTPITLKNKIIKFMKKNNIELIPIDKFSITLYCEGKVKLNDNYLDIFKVLDYLRSLGKERFECKVIFMPPEDDNKELLETNHNDFKRYYFQKKNPMKMKQEEIDEYIKLIDILQKRELNQEESEKYDLLKKKEDEERFGKITFTYKIKNKKPLIINKFWRLSELIKVLNGLVRSLSYRIRSHISTQKRNRNGELSFQKEIDGIISFFDSVKEFSNTETDNNIINIREMINNEEKINAEQLDIIINNICKFIVSLKDLFFINLNEIIK